MARKPWEWTKADEDLLCGEVINTHDLMEFSKATRRTLDTYWDQIAGRLWPKVQTTGEGARKRWAECKDRFFQDMKAEMEAQEALRTELADHDDAWARAEDMLRKYEASDRDLAEVTHDNVAIILDTLYAVEENVARLCQAWEIKPARSSYDEAHQDI